MTITRTTRRRIASASVITTVLTAALLGSAVSADARPASL
jgi:hypothetical protein